jgi:diguanylate cyclase (GGDEF)-like protein/PAS domain S-box-containing protein
MAAAPVHPEEAMRLRALDRTGLLDTPPEERFDRLTRLVAGVLDVPMAVLTLVDEERQWFKSSVGLALAQTDRDVAFCAHAVAEPDTVRLVVEDATRDPRFADNPLVTGDPGVRFYAGHVVRSPDGYPLGTLCAIDDRPRSLTPAQEAVLADLAALAEEEIARQRGRVLVERLDASERVKSLVLRSLHEGVVLQAADGRIVEWNPAAEGLLGLLSEEMAGLTSHELKISAIHPDGSPWPTDDHPSMVCLRTGEPVRDVTMGVHRPDDTLVWLRVDSQPATVEGAQGALTVFIDITEQALLSARLEHLATHDPLTDLPNRSLLGARAERALAAMAEGGRGPAVAYFDLDGFKGVNDTEGHAAGDGVLVEVARRLRRACGPDDVACRLGGDEFVVLVAAVADEEEAGVRTEALCTALREPPITVGAGTVGASCGVAVARPGDTTDALLQRADAELYGAKRRRP